MFAAQTAVLSFNRYVAQVRPGSLTVPLVLASENNEVLAVWIWIYWQAGRIPEAAAIGVMLILITAVMGLAARKLVGESLSGPRH